MISDWQGIDRITTPPGTNYSYSVEAGVGAGIDMVISLTRGSHDTCLTIVSSSRANTNVAFSFSLTMLCRALLQIMVPFAFTEFIDDLTAQVKSGIIPMSRIDDAVYRILRVKFTMGLFESPYADPSLAGELGKQVSPKIPRFVSLKFHSSRS